MTSLRRTALLWMTAMLSIVGIAGAAVSYWLASDEANAFLDGQLRQIALNAGEGVTDTADPPIQHDPEDDFAVEIWNGAGETLHASRSAVDVPGSPSLALRASMQQARIGAFIHRATALEPC